MKQHYTDQDMKIAILESNSNNLLSALNRIEISIKEMQTDMNRKFDKVDEQFGKVYNKLWFLLIFIFATSGSLLTVMAKGFKWL
jgi:hypothetical protein